MKISTVLSVFMLCIFYEIQDVSALNVDAILTEYKRMTLRLREDYYQGNLPIEPTYDFIIVGASPSGCVLANRLTENENVTVLVMEAGPEGNIYTDIPAMSTLSLFTDFNWNYKTQYRENSCRGMDGLTCVWPSGKGIGGGTLINGLIYTRGNSKDFDRWAELGNEGWSYDDVLPYFKRLENMLIPELRNSPYHGTDGPVPISYAPYRTKLSHVFLQAGKEMGFNVTDYNAKGQHLGFSQIQMTQANGRRFSASNSYLYPIRFRKNLHITQKTIVSKILIDPATKEAYGVEFYKKGKKRRVRARKEVIVSAGSFKSPQLLMLSGIGPRSELTRLGIPVLKDLPVGENLQEHVGTTGLAFTVDRPDVVPHIPTVAIQLPLLVISWTQGARNVLTTSGAEDFGYFKSTHAENGDHPDIELISIFLSYGSDNGANLRKNYAIRDDIYIDAYKALERRLSFGIWVMGMYPKSRGTVKLASRNPFEQPIIDHNFFDHPDDMDVVIQGIKKAIAVSETPAMKSIGARLFETRIPTCSNFTFSTDEYWDCFVREVTGQYHHQCGTCSMGTVVDQRLKVYGIKKLRVVDASIMPLIPGTHTMAPSYMIGEKASDMIREDHNLF